MASIFPAQFADLERFADWAIPTEYARYAKRIASPMDELQDFYDATFPRIDEVVEYLKGVEYSDDMAEPDKRLLWLYCALATVSFPVEVWRQPRVPDAGLATFDAVLEPAV